MSDRAKKSTKKKPSDSVILVDRKAFLSALELTSICLQAMGDEFESLRVATQMPKEMRKAMMQIVSAHLRNVSVISSTFQLSMYDPIDPEGNKGRDLN